MTRLQEYFDRALTGMRSQGRPSVEGEPVSASDANCLYRGPGGDKCNIGWLIDDDVYRPDMDSYGSELKNVLKQAGIRIKLKTAQDLQGCHDDVIGSPTGLSEELRLARFMFSYEQAMSDFAYRHRLTYTPPAAELLTKWKRIIVSAWPEPHSPKSLEALDNAFEPALEAEFGALEAEPA